MMGVSGHSEWTLSEELNQVVSNPSEQLKGQQQATNKQEKIEMTKLVVRKRHHHRQPS